MNNTAKSFDILQLVIKLVMLKHLNYFNNYFVQFDFRFIHRQIFRNFNKIILSKIFSQNAYSLAIIFLLTLLICLSQKI